MECKTITTSRGKFVSKVVKGDGQIENSNNTMPGTVVMLVMQEQKHDEIVLSLNIGDVSIMCTLNSDHLLIFDQIVKGEFCK